MLVIRNEGGQETFCSARELEKEIHEPLEKWLDDYLKQYLLDRQLRTTRQGTDVSPLSNHRLSDV